MPTYITLFKYTPKGIGDIKHSPDRLAALKKMSRDRGGDIKAFYLTMGQYDGVVIEEAPNDEAMAEGLLTAGSQGFITTETLRAFTEDEFRKILSKVP